MIIINNINIEIMNKLSVKCIAILIVTIFFQAISISSWAQSPQKISYQAVIRDLNGNLVQSSPVGMRINIIQGSENGTVVYTETQTPTTNANGLVSIEIGSGIGFNLIDWANGPYFIKNEIDPLGGVVYTITGTSQLLSVPYALFAEASGTAGPTGATGVTGVTGATGITGPTGSSPVHTIGENYGGGKIFWLDASGQRGLIAAKVDLSTGIQWYNGTYTTTGASLDGVYAGRTNTNLIISNQGAGAYAAQICNDYAVTVINEYYDDWYLPSKYELDLLYLQKNVIGGFTDTLYWSSTENFLSHAWVQDFNDGSQATSSKFTPNFVRAIRAF